LLYASYLAKEYDVIAVGVSGETTATLQVNYFVHLKGQLAPYEITATDILGFDDVYDLYIQSPQTFNVDYSDLLDIRKN
jgi:type I restriction enzyme M protein